jgi:hypothetical protein
LQICLDYPKQRATFYFGEQWRLAVVNEAIGQEAEADGQQPDLWLGQTFNKPSLFQKLIGLCRRGH